MRGDVLLFLVFAGFSAAMQVGNMACTVTGKRPSVEEACLDGKKELLVVAGNHRTAICNAVKDN